MKTSVSEREWALKPWNVLCNAPNKSSPSNLREIRFLVCIFFPWCDGLISAHLGCSIRVLLLNIYSEKKKQKQLPLPDREVFCEFCGNPLLTSPSRFHAHNYSTVEERLSNVYYIVFKTAVSGYCWSSCLEQICPHLLCLIPLWPLDLSEFFYWEELPAAPWGPRRLWRHAGTWQMWM